MIMKKKLVFVGSAVLLASYLSGCDDPGNDLLVDYQTHALDAKAEVVGLHSSGMNTESMTTMQAHVGEHLTEMRAIRMKMMEQCRQAARCPDGGGATGEMHSGHMNGGRYLDRDLMDKMSKREQDVEDAMDSMSDTCDAPSEDVQACWGEHADMVAGSFEDMADACDDMMSDHMGGSGMMGGGSGMMTGDGM
jgi:hypothetical protein